MKTGKECVDGSRLEEDLPGDSPDPRSDQLLYRPPQVQNFPHCPQDDTIGLYAHTGPGGTTAYYLGCLPGTPEEGRTWPLGSRFEAAMYILGSEGRDLARLDEPGREQIRSHFPEIFRYFP